MDVVGELDEHRSQLVFTFEDLIEASLLWPCAYGWWAWMNVKPWGPLASRPQDQVQPDQAGDVEHRQDNVKDHHEEA